MESRGRPQKPYYVYPASGDLFAFAGLWEKWNDLETCAIITTDANPKMGAVHDRMPVIVSPEEYSNWLAGGEGLLRPCPDQLIGIRRVSRALNNARNEDPRLIEPVAS